jgi:hypothetical protein
MEENQPVEVVGEDTVLESPIESEETTAKDQTDVMRPAQVRLIEYPKDFGSHQLHIGKTFQVNGEVFEVYNEMDKKHGKPRYMIRGLGLLAVVE